MAKDVSGGVFRNSRPLDSASYRFLNDCFMDVVAPLDISLLIEIPATGWKHELPSPLRIRIGILAGQRVRQCGASRAFEQIPLVGALRTLQVSQQVLFRCCREHGYPILAAFCTSNPAFHFYKIEILPAQSQTFQ